MDNNSKTSFTQETVALPMVRLDTVNEAYTISIKKYFEYHGCVIVRNIISGIQNQYHIIYGNYGFVKTIIEQKYTRAKKTLVLLVRGTEEEAESLKGKGVYIVRILYAPISLEAVKIICNFFFAGKKDTLNLIPENKIKKIDKKKTSVINEKKTAIWRPLGPEDLERIEKISVNIFHTKPHKHKNKKKTLVPERSRMALTAVFLLCAFIFTPIFAYSISVFISVSALLYGRKMFEKGNVISAQKASVMAQKWSGVSKAMIIPIRGAFSLIGREEYVRDFETLSSFLTHAARIEKGASELMIRGSDIFSSLIQPLSFQEADNSRSVAPELEDFHNELFLISNSISEVEAQWKAFFLNADKFRRIQNTKTFHLIEEHIVQLREDLEFIDRCVFVYKKASGFGEEKTYLVLLQNSMEIRPTGGFIGSVARVTFYEGKMTDFTIQDVYALDGQLRGHVDPPGPVRDILGQEHWYLRDSNWDPDFQISGEKALWFYEKEAGERLDGVIALNSSFIRRLLEAVGPVPLTDFGDQITASNFFGKSLYYTQKEFFPGSTQKKDFLGDLAQGLVQKLSGSGFQGNANTLRIFRESLLAHDILLYFTNKELNEFAGLWGWAGEIEREKDSDFLYIVEANLGVNKVNYFLTRDLFHKVKIEEDGSIIETMSLYYENTSGSQPGAGNYKTFTRFYFPKDARITEVVYNGKAVNEDTKKSNVMPYKTAILNRDGLKELGVFYEISHGEQARIGISYIRNEKLVFGADGKGEYKFLLQKQPGDSATNFSFVLQFPLSFIVEEGESDKIKNKYSKSFLAKEQQLEYNTLLSHDEHHVFTFIR